ncbi:hypothetical protein J3459_008213 [Metarhizium acridum]|uniref:Uncharacterized protein n=1 Tax=Metarhizium acridum (strain CQMa 102) TaxID=655827 RepID=E9EHX1_METAQ|nr:uncharacterized protein MAC_09469 [Metarhizium acridum CQMa 102]EFY84494.1 hypothetical protein MAC_09469 [Metarhizium acridum CQMa 102]KAG8423089.1 hypothetical protein J3458_000009 [Metarhizium acridum]KAG8426299.1 hypothetical protein J3459_008213 [Metarhizium acridum]
MKFVTVAVAALASVAAAWPYESKCKPATYRCQPYHQAWEVCNTRGEWVFAGRCPPGTVCKFNQQNGSPYCLPRRHDLYTEEFEEFEI